MSDELRKIADAHNHTHLADAVESIGSALTDLADWFRTEYAGLPDHEKRMPGDHGEPWSEGQCDWNIVARGRCLLTAGHRGSHQLPDPAEIGDHCSANVGGDPASGCDELATGPDGLCDQHRNAAAVIAAYDGDGAIPAPVEDDPNWVPHPDHPHVDWSFDDWQLAADGAGVIRYPIVDRSGRRWWFAMDQDETQLTDEQMSAAGPLPMQECVIVPLPSDHDSVVINRSTGTVRLRGSGSVGPGSVARLAGELIRAGRELQTAPSPGDV